MPQIGERDAALFHCGPSMIINEDSATAREGSDSALRFRSPDPPDDSAGLGILSGQDILLIIPWTGSRQGRWQPARKPSRSGRPRLGKVLGNSAAKRIATIGFTGQRTNATAPSCKRRWGR